MHRGFLFLATLLAATASLHAQNYPNARSGGNYMHNYYLPPAGSSTPWWPTWSPDGQWIAFASHGSLWRLRVTNGTSDGVAEEIAHAREYLSSPEWSPDGRFLAYTSDDGGRSINLRLLDLKSQHSTDLTTGDYLNLEPAWSPDGQKLAFVSTAPNGYFNVFVMAIAGGKPGAIVQVTTDHTFGSNRLYFGDNDVHISPSWSPDGRELLFVSNRGIALGSGGVWRAPVEADVMNSGRARLIHKEETLYRTRPVWSSDGKRFIYASHLGGQFTNLFVLPASGGEPYKMTFGEFDSFLPRWSPDGEWIAYVSNELGLPQLKLLKTWGGEQRVIPIRERKWSRPFGRVNVTVVDETTGQPTPARVYQSAADGKPYTPSESYERISQLRRRLFHTSGRYVAEVPAGSFTIEAVKGFEYSPAKVTAQVEAGRTVDVRVPIRRMVNLKAKGWFSGSNHVHMNYAGNLHNTPENIFLMNAAEDADVIGLQIANKDNRVLDYQLFVPGQAQHPLSTKERIMHVGQEYRPPFYGHISLFNLQKHLVSPFVTGYEGTGVELYPSNTDIFRYAKEQGGIGAYVHPYSGTADPVESTLGTAKSFPVDVALGAVSYHELWSQSAGDAPLMVWYRLLNSGFRVPVTGGEDSISNLHNIELVASVRGYFHLGRQPLTWANWMSAMLNGRGFVTNGPLIEFTVNDRLPGEEISAKAGERIHVKADVHSLAPLERVELVRNGEVVHTANLAAGGQRAQVDLPLEVTSSGWYSVRAIGAARSFPVENTRPQAVTNPVFVIVANHPIRDRASAEYFVKWIDRLTQMASEHPGWRSDREKAHVLGQFTEARGIYVKRAAEAH